MKTSSLPAGLFFLAALLSAILLFTREDIKTMANSSPAAQKTAVSLQDSKNTRLDVRQARAPMTRSWNILLREARKKGWKGHLNGPLSGLRTHGQQKKLYLDFIRGVGAPAFHPNGPSRHLRKRVKEAGQWSQAVDVSKPDGLIEAARKLGVRLYQPYADEPWHIEAKGPFVITVKQSPSTTYSQLGVNAVSPLIGIFLIVAALVLGLFFRGRVEVNLVDPSRFLSRTIPLIGFLFLCAWLFPPATGVLMFLSIFLAVLFWPHRLDSFSEEEGLKYNAYQDRKDTWSWPDRENYSSLWK